ncbi:MAG: hypothetical protein JNG86_06455 [Verrucomicrobiaceae bacterium]|nr:hypothetical protein [Verrucomicrobiaceae bacterium]
MILFRVFALASIMMTSCVSLTELSKVAPGTGDIIISQEERRECKAARVILPAGRYTPEVQSDLGVYYLAPARIRTEGVLISGGYRGGLFIARDGRQAVWFGDARDDADERPGTLMGAIGVAAPKLWPFKPAISVTQVGVSR